MREKGTALLGWTLVAAQLAALAALAVSAPILARGGWLVIQVAAGVLGLWAALSIRPRHLRATPGLAPGATLVRHGPFRWVRHPMYTALLLLTIAWLGDAATPTRWIAAAVLVIVLSAKIAIEERVLRERFADYHAYAERTKRVIPGVW